MLAEDGDPDRDMRRANTEKQVPLQAIDFNALRKGRVNTYAAPSTTNSMHREEISVDPEALAKMYELNEKFHHRESTDSSLCCTPCVAEPLIFEPHDFYYAWGQNGSWLITAKLPSFREKPHQIRAHEGFPGGQQPHVLEEWGVGVSTQKGCKGPHDEEPGQDNYSIARLSNGWEIACVMDGHGFKGHWPSHRAVRALPMALQSDSCTHMLRHKQVEAALRHAFSNTETDLKQWADIEGVDLNVCGSTACCILRNPEECPNRVWVATVGDSRCIHVSQKGLIGETIDHKPTDPKELERLEKMGCDVRSKKHSNGFVETRIFLRGEDWPGLCMSRSLGDLIVKGRGVSWEPTIVEWQTSPVSLLVACSDGVWEFMGNDRVAELVMQLFNDGSCPQAIAQHLRQSAKQVWKQTEGDYYCDDITAIIFPMGAPRAPKTDIVVEPKAETVSHAAKCFPKGRQSKDACIPEMQMCEATMCKAACIVS